MAGYHGYSMSNNAVDAYENGEMPLSKWSKKAIIERIEEAINEGDIEIQFSLDELKKLPLKALREFCLIYTSWHHTSKFYNKTDFYSLDVSYLKRLTNETIKKLISAYKKGEAVDKISETDTIDLRKTIHDGVSPIIVPAEYDDDEAFDMLWEELVPCLGRAYTAQGEVIRIASKVSREFYHNDCDKWDEDYQKMMDTFLKYLQLGNGFNGEDLKAAEVLVREVKEKGKKGIADLRLPDALCDCAVAWVKQNTKVIALLEADYIR